jgi:amidohydrolase
LHCEPKLAVGLIGTRVGPITSATDQIKVILTSHGGHTSRPHLTGDVVFALGEVITQVPGILGRRLDPRSGVNLTWGRVTAGDAANAIPAAGELAGTLRCLDVRAWEEAGDILDEAIAQVVAPFTVKVELEHLRGVPPVENDPAVTKSLERAASAVVGAEHVVATEQSLGGEDFAWYLTKVPGALARLGTGHLGASAQDLHQGNLDIDEGAIAVGTAFFANYVMGGTR